MARTEQVTSSTGPTRYNIIGLALVIYKARSLACLFQAEVTMVGCTMESLEVYYINALIITTISLVRKVRPLQRLRARPIILLCVATIYMVRFLTACTEGLIVGVSGNWDDTINSSLTEGPLTSLCQGLTKDVFIGAKLEIYDGPVAVTFNTSLIGRLLTC